MNREVQVRNSVRGSGWNSLGLLGVCHEQKSRRQTTLLRSCVVDEGRPFGAALQEEASNCPPLLLPKGSGGERRGKRPGIKLGQVTLRKRNESKSPLLMSKIAKTISKPRFVRRLRDKFRRSLVTSGTVSGI